MEVSVRWLYLKMAIQTSYVCVEEPANNRLCIREARPLSLDLVLVPSVFEACLEKAGMEKRHILLPFLGLAHAFFTTHIHESIPIKKYHQTLYSFSSSRKSLFRKKSLHGYMFVLKSPWKDEHAWTTGCPNRSWQN